MPAVDINVIIRFLTRDDPQQAARARAFVEANPIWVATTVLLETEWVLRSVYRFPRPAVVQALRDFAGLVQVTLEDPAGSAQALEWCEQGMDLADALHLATTSSQDAFVTFDTALVAQAQNVAGVEVRAL